MFDPLGPFPLSYDSGLRASIAVLYKSNQPGRHEAKVKFSAARKARGIHTNMFRASAKGYLSTMVLRSDKKRSVLSCNPTDSEFYTAFTKGLEHRIGQRVKRDMAVSIEVMIKFQERAEREWEAAVQEDDQGEMRRVAEWAAYFTYSYCHSLRGWEVVKATHTALRLQIVDEFVSEQTGESQHIGLPLFGRFKSCGNSPVKLLCMMAASTASGLQPLRWTKRLLSCLDEDGPSSDWLFQNRDGTRLKMSHFNDIFYDYLLEVQSLYPNLIPEDLDVTDEFFLGRSFRRGATTRAQNASVPGPDIDWVNRWGTGQELVIKGPMRVIYSERRQMLETFLRFSRAL